MKPILIHLSFLLGLSLLACVTRPAPTTTTYPTTTDPMTYQALWKEIDSLEAKGLTRSVLEKVTEVKARALADDNSQQLVRAVLYERKSNMMLQEDSDQLALTSLEAELASYPEPARSILHGYAARWYNSYLESNLWRLSNQTPSPQANTEDIRTWNIRQFVDQINQHYLHSVQWPGLKNVPVSEYTALLTDAVDTDTLRPTLYDVLLHQALEYFKSAQSQLTQPMQGFDMTDPRLFAPAADFISLDVPTPDSLSLSWRAIRLFQDLLTFRLADEAHPGALIDADVLRLEFIHGRYTREDKDSLYLRALESIQDRFGQHPESTLASHRRAVYYQQRAGTWSPGQDSDTRFDFQKAVAIAEQAIQSFPEAYGSQLCRQLLVDIRRPSATVTMEEVVLPDEEQLAFVRYRNLAAAHFRVLRLPQVYHDWEVDRWDTEAMRKRLNALSPVATWSQTLADEGDYQTHTTEVAVPPLPFGHYALVLSPTAAFSPADSISGVVFFSVSRIGYWTLQDRGSAGTGLVVDRKTGLPMSDVKVECLVPVPQSGRRRPAKELFATLTTDPNGMFLIPEVKDRHMTFRFTHVDDELYPQAGIYSYRHFDGSGRDRATLFFTDRSIYRPGQRVFFKGYAVRFDQRRVPAVATGEDVEVSFLDANYKVISQQHVKTNEYGTFSGHVDIPQGGLTGRFSIKSSFGSQSQSIQVEEYKRPKFEINFDTLKGAPALEDEVDARAVARNYAGPPVTGAVYDYKVERMARHPWWWGYRMFPPGRETRQLIASGRGVTDESGGIPISFTASAGTGDDAQMRYSFEITVTVTDVTGESHEARKVLALNRQGYEVFVDLPEKVEEAQLNKVMVRAAGTEGNAITVQGELRVTPLAGPDRVQRDRLWAIPDMPVLTEDEYAARFPSYRAPSRETMDRWPALGPSQSRSLVVSGDEPVDLSSLLKTPGHYRLDWTWKDERGKSVDIQQHVTVYSFTRGLPANELFLVNPSATVLQPGQSLSIGLLSGLKEPPRAYRHVERSSDSAQGWSALTGQPVDVLTARESDRGGLSVHHFLAYNNRFEEHHLPVMVPWSNKQLDVQLTSWRDHMEPGSNETWSLTVKGEKGEQVSAELLMSMYDASLDAFLPHQWTIDLYPSFSSRLRTTSGRPGSGHYMQLIYMQGSEVSITPRVYREFPMPGWSYAVYRPGVKMRTQTLNAPSMEASDAAAMVEADEGAVAKEIGEAVEETAPAEAPALAPPLRTALEETVFFYPELRTDSAGHLVFTFRMKEALTRWKFQALAHTRDLAYGLQTALTETRKNLMVFPNPPRFFREGDTISFPAKVSNLVDESLSAIAGLRIVNALTDEDVSALWGVPGDQVLTMAPGGSVSVKWMLRVPRGWTVPVKYQVRAEAGAHTDGEESWVPVVTNRILITETLPLPMKADERRTFVFASMAGERSATQTDHRFTVEMTTSPAWYAVQALPYLMEYPHEGAEQIFSRYYANQLGAHILNKLPGIAHVYEQWRSTGDPAMLSPLSKNQELKSAILEETPWVRDAMGEEQQRRDMALLFDQNRLRYAQDRAMEKLATLQSGNGGFPWFPGGRDSWYITQHIVAGFGHLNKLGVAQANDGVSDLIRRAVPYLDGELMEWYEQIEKQVAAGKTKWTDPHAGALQAHYLYTRSFFPDIESSGKLVRVWAYLREQFQAHWLQHSLYEQGLMALGIHRLWPEDELPATILASLRERTILHEELGRYWKTLSGYHWYEAPVERQSLLIELFQDLGAPAAETDELRVWLLKQKQTRQWTSTKATTAAVYALLIHPDAWLTSIGQVSVRLGDKEVLGSSEPGQAGSGYRKKQWEGKDIGEDWSRITVDNPNPHIAWGSAYWQYWEDLDKVRAEGDPGALAVTRSVWKLRTGDRGTEAVAAPAGAFSIGDRLLVRLTVETDRAMEFVHIKDMRASGVEPLETLSGYRWNGGLGYYQSTRDLATHFFVDYLPRGKYVLEYEVFAVQAGDYAGGLATIQCMYAPEFAAHSEGIRMHVRASDQ